MLDWQTGDIAYDSDDFEPENDPRQPRRLWRFRRWWLLGLPVGALLVALWVFVQGPHRYSQLVSDVQATTDLELWAWKSRDIALYESLLDPNMPIIWRQQHSQEFRLFPQGTQVVRRGTPQVSVDSVDIRGDAALVVQRVRVPDQPGLAGRALEYTHAVPYRRFDGRWLRSSPDPALWGHERHLTTHYFEFFYTERDADTIAALAADIDDLYAQICGDLALDAPPGPKWTLALTLDPPLAGTTPDMNGRRITLSSPSLATLPAGVTPTRYLRERFVGWVGDALVAGEPWAHVSSGLPTWNLPLAVVARDIARWDKSGGPRPESLDPPEDWQTLRQSAEWINVTTSVLDYVESQYGAGAIPQLVQGARHGTTTWDRLLPTALGVSRGEFEAAWLSAVQQTARRAP
ncbi:MAG: hypothetical protein U0641_01205 [Anaerolineae bacterium]